MKQKELILLFTVIVAAALSFYIMGQESKDLNEIDSHVEHDHESTVQILNRGETKVTLKPGYDQIGRLQAKIPDGWKREQPASSMRIAQFQISGKDGGGELIVFSGIGGSVDANLERWYGQFKSETQQSVSETAVKSHDHINGMNVTFSYAYGTYMKSSMGMGGSTTEMPNYALTAAIVSAPDGPYYFKGTGSKSTMDAHKANFETFIQSIEAL